MRRRVNKATLSRMVELIQEGLSSEEISARLNADGSTTPNGCVWSRDNVSYYKSSYKLSKKAYQNVGVATKNTSKPRVSVSDKIKFILELNLSKETMIKVLTEVV